ncbi:hypothetical protein CC1G_01083 [Coprinopsis cinerea okayama7|uniref:F-box domain-containing protein n=1 Tax=Coprinopsis cinerea (strain Okayama-7 / 130 / ATCC MYA-4618 / FGSC 9003) TaxID=240176 RepID=A8NEG7_COPC7|nr:hypothetical protein CC1G_01083 [Coprinopsis cinerea okayama7\|eukprot:XP_001833021.1 hypothetical protein CC1G_01083 [Coprinopsis cinerea okayama7\
MASIQEDTARLAAVDSRIYQIDRELDELSRQRHDLCRENQKLRSNIEARRVENAPMRTLIPELCDLVFSYYLECCCDYGCAAGFELCPVAECDPLILAQVCRRWRYMVLNSPCIWANLHIRLNNSKMNISSQINHWFKHALNVPVSVTVCPGLPLGSRWDSEAFRKVNILTMRELRPFLDRIKSLKLYVHQSAYSALFPSNAATSMVRLAQLSLEHRGYILDEFQIGRLHSPNLRTLRLCDPSPLTSLFGDGLSPRTLHIDKSEFWEFPRRVAKLLTDCVDLRDLSIIFPRNLISCTQDTVVLPSVSRLKLEWYYASSPVPLFRSIIAPQLQHLTVSHSNFLATFSRETMNTLRYLMQSSYELITITISGCNLTSMCGLLSTFCHHAPQLQELTIHGCYGLGVLLEALSPSKNQDHVGWPCPNLAHVKVFGLRERDLDALFSFTRERMAPVDGQASTLVPRSEYLRELTIDSRLQDFTLQSRTILLMGLDLIRPSVRINGPLKDASLNVTMNSYTDVPSHN